MAEKVHVVLKDGTDYVGMRIGPLIHLVNSLGENYNFPTYDYNMGQRPDGTWECQLRNARVIQDVVAHMSKVDRSATPDFGTW
jgi:hypothetical protein